MDITYLGHSSFKLKGKTVTLITDPFDPKMVGIKYPSIEGDIVTISHSHPDHAFLENITNAKHVLSEPGEYEISDVSIIGLPSYHDNQKGAERGKNTIFVIEMDGVRLVHLGDLGHTLNKDVIDDIGDVDVLFVPVGGEYTIGPTEAVEVVQAIEPSTIVPMHYQQEGLSSETFSKLSPADAFIKQIGVNAQTLPKLVIKEGGLEEEQKLILLERK